MGITTLFGLPAHPLLVHLPIVLLPLVGAAAIAMACSSRVRDRIGWITVVLAGIAMVGIWLATESGEALEDSVERSAALRDHTSLADSMLALSIVFFGTVVALMLAHWWSRRSSSVDDAAPTGRALPRWLTPVLGVLVVVVAVGVNVQLVRVGHNGAKASWEDVKVEARSGERGGDGDGDGD